MFGLGLPEILLILVIALLIFGAAKLPEIGRALGKSLSEFKKGMQDLSEKKDDEEKKEEKGDKRNK
ncbi:MAG: twin-arginine translocase TatA/TatE family subunit [Candidatus Omnitrophica bacterium]|nr:twin-arginine translocase TatA/TatE family subunit [Candidatus Omnitrophota bacterium]